MLLLHVDLHVHVCIYTVHVHVVHVHVHVVHVHVFLVILGDQNANKPRTRQLVEQQQINFGIVPNDSLFCKGKVKA